MECYLPISIPKAFPVWIALDSEYTARPVRDSRLKTDLDGNLWILNVNPSDDSMFSSQNISYVCTVFNYITFDYKISAQYFVNVLPKSDANSIQQFFTQLYVSPQTKTALVGSKLQLFCIFGGDPIPKISWFKDNKFIHDISPEDSTVWVRDENTLEFTNVSFSDAGLYKCLGSNNHINNEIDSYIELTVVEPPRIEMFSVSSEDDLNKLNVQCVGFGEPKPLIRLSWNGNRIESNNGKVYDYNFNEPGRLKCEVINEYGAVYGEINV